MTALLAAWGLVSRLLTFLGIPKWLPAAGIAGGLALTGAYWKGHSDAAGACREAELRAQIAALARDVAAAEAAHRLEAAQTKELEAQRQQLAKEVADYEAALKDRPEPNCTLSPHDVRSLGGLSGKRGK